MDNSKDVKNTLISTKSEPKYLNDIIEKLEPLLYFKHAVVNSRFTFNCNQELCYLVKSGVISLYRQPDDILLDFFEAPCIRGIVDFPPGSNSTYIIKVIEPADIAFLSKETLFELLSQNQLWEKLARHLLVASGVVAENLFKLTTPAAYDIVSYQLHALMDASPSVRDNILAVEYICHKSRLSRSRVMAILSEFRKLGYIMTENGFLKEISFPP